MYGMGDKEATEMTTTQESPTVGELLKARRDGGAKAPIYRRLGVSPQTYDAWEANMYVPGDEYAETLADHLELELQEIVWRLYDSRIRRQMGGYVALLRLTQPTAYAVAA